MIAEARKLETKIKDLTLDDTQDLWKALQSRDKLMEAHEKALQKAAIAAYEAGVGSKKLAEFLKDKGFAAAYKALETDRKLLVSELIQLEKQCDKCGDAASLLTKMIAVMDKALVASKGKDKSADRSTAKKVRDGLYARFNELSSAADLALKPDKYMTSFDGQFDKLIDHLIAQAFKKGKDPEAQAEMPQPLGEKKLQAAEREVAQQFKVVKTSLEKKAALTPPNGAIELLGEKAWAAFHEMRKVVDDQEALLKKFRKELQEADPKGVVADKIAGLVKHYDEAQKMLKEDAARQGKEVKRAEKEKDKEKDKDKDAPKT